MRFILKIRYNLLRFVACIIEKKVVFREKGQIFFKCLFIILRHYLTNYNV